MKKSVLLLILTAMAITASACNGSDVTDVTSSQNNQDEQPDAGQSSDGNYQSQTEQTDFPGPDTAMLVNLRGDTTTVYKLADGRYMDRTNTVYTYQVLKTTLFLIEIVHDRKTKYLGINRTILVKYGMIYLDKKFFAIYE